MYLCFSLCTIIFLFFNIIRNLSPVDYAIAFMISYYLACFSVQGIVRNKSYDRIKPSDHPNVLQTSEDTIDHRCNKMALYAVSKLVKKSAAEELSSQNRETCRSKNYWPEVSL